MHPNGPRGRCAPLVCCPHSGLGIRFLMQADLTACLATASEPPYTVLGARMELTRHEAQAGVVPEILALISIAQANRLQRLAVSMDVKTSAASLRTAANSRAVRTSRTSAERIRQSRSYAAPTSTRPATPR